MYYVYLFIFFLIFTCIILFVFYFYLYFYFICTFNPVLWILYVCNPPFAFMCIMKIDKCLLLPWKPLLPSLLFALSFSASFPPKHNFLLLMHLICLSLSIRCFTHFRCQRVVVTVNLTFTSELFWRNRKDKKESFC